MAGWIQDDIPLERGNMLKEASAAFRVGLCNERFPTEDGVAWFNGSIPLSMWLVRNSTASVPFLFFLGVPGATSGHGSYSAFSWGHFVSKGSVSEPQIGERYSYLAVMPFASSATVGTGGMRMGGMRLDGSIGNVFGSYDFDVAMVPPDGGYVYIPTLQGDFSVECVDDPYDPFITFGDGGVNGNVGTVEIDGGIEVQEGLYHIGVQFGTAWNPNLLACHVPVKPYFNKNY